MTFKPHEQACYIYITLPGQTKPVTAGRYTLTTDQQGVSLGRFVYGKSYLQRPDAVAFDPVELTLTAHTYETAALNGVFGVLRDAGPDYWGRLVIDKHSGQASLGELDYLLHSPDDRAGALGFGLNKTPPAPKRQFNQTITLEKLQEIADAIVQEHDFPIDDLLLIGTSMGGARPKTVAAFPCL